MDKEYLLMKVDTDININSVLLSDDNKNKINEFLIEYKNKDRLIIHGLKPMNRLLFYGASGCGKTYLAKALSNHMKYTMLYIDIANSLSNDNVAENISTIFDYADEKKKCIVFLDECDSVAWSRDNNGADTGKIRRATNSIFQHLDQMSTDNIFIAATNLLHKVDPAFERRFNLKLEFNRPNTELTDVIKKFLFKDFELVYNVDKAKKDIVEKISTLSYYEIQSIVEREMKNAVINNTNKVSLASVYDKMASALNFKFRINTVTDDENTYKSSIV